jgi:transposase
MPRENGIPFDLPGLHIDQVEQHKDVLIISAHRTEAEAPYPYCGQSSASVHSYYTRSVKDLPCSGRLVRLVLQVRRFYCLNARCKQTTFAERFPQLVPVHGQRTKRMTRALRALAHALSAEAGAQLAQRLSRAVSGDTLADCASN